MHHYPFHIKDYQCDTVHLTNEQDLVYRRLLDFYYDTESPIANDKQKLSVRLRVAEHTLSEVLAEFFVECDDGYRHARCDAEIERYQSKVAQTKSAGKLGGAKKRDVLKANAKRTLSGRVASATNQEPLTKNQEPEKEKEKPLSAEADGAPQDEFTDDRKMLFDYGREVLKKKGVPDKTIGALIGKMLKTIDEGEAMSILGALDQKGDINAVGYIQAALLGKGTSVYRDLKSRYGRVDVLGNGKYNCGGRIFNADGTGGLCV